MTDLPIEGDTRDRTAKKPEKRPRTPDEVRSGMEEGLRGASGDILSGTVKKTKVPAPRVGDGNLTIACMDPGQGDCTLIMTPGGARIMIDCGYDPGTPVGDRHKALAGAVSKFLGDGGDLDVLILTHSDKDHFNLITKVLAGVTIKNVYYSGTIGEYGTKLQKFFATAVAAPPKTDPNPGCDPIKRVTCRWKELPVLASTAAFVQFELYPRNSTKIQVGTFGTEVDAVDGAGLRIWKEPTCAITILAGNVEKGSVPPASDGEVTISDGGDKYNVGCLVTLVEAFASPGKLGKRVLICGDATRSTESYLIEKSGNRIENVDLLLVPHHGSAITSSTLLFVAKTNPRQIVFSSGQERSSYNHPEWATVRRYLTNFAAKSHTPSGSQKVALWNRSIGGASIPAPTDREKTALGISRWTSGADGLVEMETGYAVGQTPLTVVLKAT